FYERALQADAIDLKSAIDYRLTVSSPSATQTISTDMGQLCGDAGLGSCGLSGTDFRRFPITLGQLDPSLLQRLQDALPIFYQLPGLAPRKGTVHSVLLQEDRFAASFADQLGALANRTSSHQHALAAANSRSYVDSRNLLIAVGAGSFALAIALGLLLAASLVAPLRRTQERLAAIAAGDFSGHVDVVNRDEIGALAADVNRMNDELRRLYSELETASQH